MKSIKKKLILGLLSLLITSSMLGIGITPATAHTEESPFKVDLIAGGGNPNSAIDVGDVFVWNDGESLYVTYQTTDDWYLVETHLAVNLSLEDIPQTKPNKKENGAGNPIPGHFEWKQEHCPPVQYYPYVIDLDGWNIGTELFIAAHAEVVHIIEDCIDVVSDTNTMVINSENFLPEDLPKEAVEALGPSAWSNLYERISGVPFVFPVETQWIWESQYVINPIIGDIIEFQRMFDIPGLYFIEKSGYIDITCDNGYELRVNDIYIGKAQLAENYLEEPLMNDIVWYYDTYPPFPSGTGPYGWQTVERWDITSELMTGLNTLDIVGVNEYQNYDEYPGVTGTIDSNPAGLKYAAHICYRAVDQEETGWGVDPCDPLRFNDKNWATYFKYTVQSAETYFIEYPETGNVYIGYEDWPNGDFDYNDFGMTLALEEVYDQEWNLMRVTMEFTAIIYDSGMNHLIHINRPIIGESSVTVERINHILPPDPPTLGKDETPEGTYLFSGDVDIILFDTAKYTYPQKQIGEKVLIEIIVYDPLSNPKDPDPTPPREFLNEATETFYDMDPIMANYDPWEEGTQYGSLFHIHSIQSTFQFGDPAIDVPYILVVPYTDWIPPYESTFILSPYGYFDDFYRYGTASIWYDPSMVTNNDAGPGGLSWGPYPPP